MLGMDGEQTGGDGARVATKSDPPRTEERLSVQPIVLNESREQEPVEAAAEEQDDDQKQDTHQDVAMANGAMFELPEWDGIPWAKSGPPPPVGAKLLLEVKADGDNGGIAGDARGAREGAEAEVVECEPKKTEAKHAHPSFDKSVVAKYTAEVRERLDYLAGRIGSDCGGEAECEEFRELMEIEMAARYAAG